MSVATWVKYHSEVKIMIEIPQQQFDTFFFEHFEAYHKNPSIKEFCTYIIECFIHGLLESVVIDNNYQELNDLLSDKIADAIWQHTIQVGDDIMTVPDDYPPDVVEFFYNHNSELAAVLCMTHLRSIDGMIRYLPEILGNAASKNIFYNDFRLTSDTGKYILRMIRKPLYVYR